MSVFLINASNLKAGGGLQVADSVCCELNKFMHHSFIVVLSSYLDKTKERILEYKNVRVITYTIPDTFKTIVMGRDGTLDKLVELYHVDAVLTIFGPSRWKPRVNHLSGFAFPQLVFPDSPFFQRMRTIERIKWRIWSKVRQLSFMRSANYYWTENPYISSRVAVLFHNCNVYTVSNYYNQVFDNPHNWGRSIILPTFEGTTCLSISSPTPHKNYGIIEETVRVLKVKYPDFRVRFVLTCTQEEWPLSNNVLDYVIYVGKVDVSDCPHLYEQASIMFMPSLLECFTATYPEAMRMNVPIVTTDLEFARGLCCDAACYYSAVDAEACAEAIYKVATDKVYAHQLVENGKKQLLKYDNYEQRAEKLVRILEEISV